MKFISTNGTDKVIMKTDINGRKVLKNLITKAEKRKAHAQNFRIYALLQSTIFRLQRDKRTFEGQRMCRIRSGVDETDRHVFRTGIDRCCPVSDFVLFCDGQDPLNLNEFFEKLKER